MEWLRSHATAVGWLTGLSAIAFLLTLFAVPVLVVRIPADYFSRTSRGKTPWKRHHPIIRLVLLLLKNLVGLCLMAVGMVLLLTPGQGLLTILAGLLLLDFPGKYHCERWLISRAPILHAVNWVRRRRGHAEIEVDHSS